VIDTTNIVSNPHGQLIRLQYSPFITCWSVERRLFVFMN